MTTYAYVSGTSDSGATITFDGPLGAPTAYNNIGTGNYKTIGFTYTSSIVSTVTFNIIPSQGAIDVYYIISQNAPSSTQNFDANTYYTATTSLNTTNLGTVYRTWTVITSSQTTTFTDIPANSYLTIIFSKNGEGNGTIAASTTACFHSETLVLMSNNTYKQIKNIVRYDEVISDIKNNQKMTVSRNIPCVLIDNEIYKIPKGLLKNNNDIFVRGIHPIWMNENERCLVKDIEGVIKIETNSMINEVFYNLQFDIEGTFFVEGIKVDSLSPYHRKIYLGEENFIDKKMFIKDIKYLNENDIKRKKPILVNRKVMPNEIITFEI